LENATRGRFVRPADRVNRATAGDILSLPVRLVSYDRRGHRQLGALLGGEVVDLPDLVGHPAFPATMEALVSSNRGSVLDAARAALEREDARESVVTDAKLLPPLLPSSLRSLEATDAVRRVVGPNEVVAWPLDAGWLDYDPKIAGVLGGPARCLSAGDAERAIFGYTLVNDWVPRDSNGDPATAAAANEAAPLALGPCIVLAEDVDPQRMFVTARVDGVVWAKGNLNGTATSLAGVIAAASRTEALRAADAFAASPFDAFARPQRPLWPGAVVELEAERIGVLRTRLGRRS
jgi:Fumarylacetoacetate (FAA) hydrolase family